MMDSTVRTLRWGRGYSLSTKSPATIHFMNIRQCGHDQVRCIKEHYLKYLKRWWRTQSESNPSPFPNSLLTGKLAGNFVEFACLVRFCMPTRKQIHTLAAKFPTQQNREYF